MRVLLLRKSEIITSEGAVLYTVLFIRAYCVGGVRKFLREFREVEMPRRDEARKCDNTGNKRETKERSQIALCT